MTDYGTLGLDPYLNATDGLGNIQDIKGYIDSQIGNIYRPGGLNYSQTADPGRQIKAVVGMSNSGARFNDIQSAINSVSNLGGGIVSIAKGTYTINSTITLNTNVSLEGVDPVGCVLDFANGTNNLVLQTGAVNSNIRRLTFKNCNNGSAVILHDAPNNCFVENCYFGTNTSAGTTFCIYSQNGLNTGFFNLRVDGCGGFLQLSNTIWSHVQQCLVYTTNIGIQGTPSEFQFVQINNCDLHCYQNSILGGLTNCHLFQNHFLNLGTAGTAVCLNFSTADSNSFVSNLIQANITGGIPVLLTNNSRYNKFTSNQIDCSGKNQTAFAIQNSSNENILVSNRITGDGAGNYAVIIGTAANDVARTIVTSNVLIVSNSSGTILNNGTNSAIANNLTQ